MQLPNDFRDESTHIFLSRACLEESRSGFTKAEMQHRPVVSSDTSSPKNNKKNNEKHKPTMLLYLRAISMLMNKTESFTDAAEDTELPRRDKMLQMKQHSS